MKLTVIEARDIPEAWWICCNRVLEEGREYIIDAGSFAGQKRKEFEMVVVRIWYPRSRPLVPITPEGIPPPTTIDYVQNEYLPYLMCSKPEKSNELYTYGDDLEPQIDIIIKKYKEEGLENNRCCMSVGNRDSIHLEHSQCLRLIDTRVLNGALDFVVYFRSWDLWSGFSSNMAAIQLMKEYMAHELDIRDGELLAFSKGLHLYDHCWELAKTLVYR